MMHIYGFLGWFIGTTLAIVISHLFEVSAIPGFLLGASLSYIGYIIGVILYNGNL